MLTLLLAGQFKVFAAASPKPRAPRAPRARKAKTPKTASKTAGKEKPASAVATVTVPAPEPAAAEAIEASSGDDEELLRLHQELMDQIEERKRAQAALSAQLGVAGSSSSKGTTVSASQKKVKPTELTFPASTASEVPPPPAKDTAEQAPAAISAQSPTSTDDIPPPPANPNTMNIVFVGAECAPWSKTGGLGDVMGALPKALAARGHRVMCIAPRYAAYDDAWETGVRHRIRCFGQDHEVGFYHTFKDGVDHVFIDHNAYLSVGSDIYGGNRAEIQFRCALLCKAALEAPWVVPCGEGPYGDDNLVFVANDWHTALLPVYLQAHYRDHGKYTYARAVFVLHNIAHQGRAPMDELYNFEIPDQYRELFRLDDPVGGEHMNIMKAGVATAHRMVAVSHGYAWECQTQDGGWGLDETLRENAWKLRGVVNGIDVNDWHPSIDHHLDEDGYHRYDVSSVDGGKAACKAALQKEMGLPVDPTIPLLAFIGRLDYQKGVDLIRDNYEWLMSENVQLVMLGSGRDDLEGALRDMEARNNNKCRNWVGFSTQMAHRITAGADILLMPSRFEPCGLNQLYAMAYGTVPVVHAVGGLRDTVKPFNPFENSGTGWTFEWADAGAFKHAMGDALYTYREHKDSFKGLMVRGMEQDLSWEHAAAQYEDVLVEAKYQW